MAVVGAGGHAKVVIDVLRAVGWKPVAVLDPSPSGVTVSDVPVVGGDDMAGKLFEQGIRHVIVAIGRNDLRRRIGARLKGMGYTLVSAVHPSAVISPSAAIGEGVVVMPNAVVNAQANVADHAIINTSATIEHDCVIGISAHMAPRSVIGGNCTIGEEVFFGIGAVARPLSVVGDRTIVGAGAVVVGEIGADLIVVGTPARAMPRLAKDQPGGDKS